jgi:hypothetical protein
MRPTFPFKRHSITLRACLDFGWRVVAHCPHCNTGSELHLARAIERAPGLAAKPLGDLLQEGAFKCYKTRSGRSCNGVLANSVTVSTMEVGILREIAQWKVWDVSGSRSAQLEDQRDWD